MLIGSGILLLVVMAVPVGLLISSPRWLWPGDQARDVKVPEYRAVPDYRDCAGVGGVNYRDTVCYDVVTRAHEAESLVLITRDITQGASGNEAVSNEAIRLDFYTKDGLHAGVATLVFLTPSGRRAYKQYYGENTWRSMRVIDGVYFVNVIYR